MNRGVLFSISFVCILTAPIGELANGAVEATEVSGSFLPNSPPVEPIRTAFLDNCIIELDQSYDISGSMKVNFRIAVRGPCGSPPGTFDESWIATGEYTARLEGIEVEGDLMYVAEVQAGGDVSGEIILTGEVSGTLAVKGNFEAGMNYEGQLGP